MAKLRKVVVSRGIFLVEAPDAKVSILCGCPADSVKHLMKRGLIVPITVNGVTFETGPNVILLSDVMIQNGNFCNLAEFPILHMLYRQGMILPNHPNNSGLKPMLVGLRDQVIAQKEYIHRGNYGLVSYQELVAAGVEPAMAQEMLRIKLHFAFGAIRSPETLIDGLILESEPLEIRNGVMIRRLSLNRFEISYAGETTEVDLSLKPDEAYEVPYLLGFHTVHREYFGVIHAGEGDGWDTDRPCMASILMFQDRVYLLDAGPNIGATLTALGIGLGEIEGIFQTHCHDDHFSGMATLLRADRRIRYFSTPMVRHSVMKKLSALVGIEEQHLYDYFYYYDLKFDTWNDIGGLGVKPLYSPHPVETNIYFFRALCATGFRSYAHFADIASTDVLKGMTCEDDQAPGMSRARFEKVLADYAMPANVKKLDIGGGLIHGSARDFIDDRSDKLVLSHIARPLNNAERAIGSGAPFGTVEVLIPGNQNFAWRCAFEYLRSYFPNLPAFELRILLTTEKVLVNPETILIREGTPGASIYLILTGTVEVIRSSSNLRNTLSAGALVGELSGLHGLPALETCRTVSFVEALCFPRGFYTDFVKRHDLFGNIQRVQAYREFLAGTRLCGEIASAVSLNRIADTMRIQTFAAGTVIDRTEIKGIALVKVGEVNRLSGSRVVETMGPGEFFGEDWGSYFPDYGHRLETTQPTSVYSIPAEVLKDIPGVRWKIFETWQRRRALR